MPVYIFTTETRRHLKRGITMWKVNPRKRMSNAWKIFEICTNHWQKCQDYDCEICNWFSAKFGWYWEVSYRKPDEQKKGELP